MAMTSIYWEKEQWGAVEALLVGAGEHCSEVEAWRLNMGHVAYMQVGVTMCVAVFVVVCVTGCV